jgi:hypothetical protein
MKAVIIPPNFIVCCVDAFRKFGVSGAMSDIELKLKAMTVGQLVENFAEISVAQDKALLYDDYAEFRVRTH